MPVARFECVRCGAPLKTTADLTPDKRIQCPRCEAIFPVPAHLLGGNVTPSVAPRMGADSASSAAAESPRVSLVDMEGILGPADSEPSSASAPARSPTPQAPAQSPTPAPPRAQAEPEPWEEELGPATSSPQSRQSTVPRDWTDLPPEEEAGAPPLPSELVGPSDEVPPTEARDAETAGVEPEPTMASEAEPEVLELSGEEPRKKSSGWIWIVLLLLLLLMAGGLGLAWYMGWLDPVLEMLGLPTVKPTAGQSDTSPRAQAGGSGITGNLSGGTNTSASKPTSTAGKPELTPPVTDWFALVGQVVSEAPPRPLAEMQCWRYVPAEANFIFCLNVAELSQHPMFRQFVQEQRKKVPTPLNPVRSFPFEPENIAEAMLCVSVNWSDFSLDLRRTPGAAIVRLHKPINEQELRMLLASESTEMREETIGTRTVLFGKDGQMFEWFACLMSPDVVIAGTEALHKTVPGLFGSLPSGVPTAWEALAHRVGNAHLAVLIRDIRLNEVLKALGPPPAEVQLYLSLLEKIRHACLKVEMTPKAIELQLQGVFPDAESAKQVASLLQTLYQSHVQPILLQLAAFAPELVQDLQKSLQIAAEQEVARITLAASYPAISKALQFLATSLGGGIPGQPLPK
ncbi:MAG: hypothetical protein RMI91_03425 [Gemmatales bacterium]|nr:hypothetical protein [Gemmatales bacterium]MDW7993682.1 hypothetical protein [Gemmatales bacterium]